MGGAAGRRQASRAAASLLALPRTGRDLDTVQRLKFDTAAGKAITIESATAGAA